MSQNIFVETLEEDRFARTTQMTIGDKTIQTPNFCTLVQNDIELNSLINLTMLSESKYLGTCVIRVYDAPKTIIPRLKNRKQTSIVNLKSVEGPFLRFSSKTLIIVDPTLEYLLYEFHAKKFVDAIRNLRSAKQLNGLMQYLEDRDAKKEEIIEKEYENWKKAFHKKFWYDLDRKQQDRNKFVGDYIDIEVWCGTEVILPPVPIVDSEGMFDIAKRINEFAKTIAPRTKPCATYLLFQKSLLSNDALVDKVIAYLEVDPTQLTIIKIKNLDLWTPGYVGQRENYKKLMDAMFKIRKRNPQKIFMALEKLVRKLCLSLLWIQHRFIQHEWVR